MESGLYRFVQSAISISVLIPTLYMFCHFGSQVTHRFEDVADAIYQLEWYRLPLDSQKHLPMMLAMAQKKIYLRAFGRNIHCSRGVFAKVNQFSSPKIKRPMICHGNFPYIYRSWI